MTKQLLNKLLKKKNDQKTWIVLGAVFIVLIILTLCIFISHKNSKIVSKNKSENKAQIEPFQKISEFNQSATGEAISDLETNFSLQSKQIDDLKKQNQKLTDQLKSGQSIPNVLPQPELQNKVVAYPQSLNNQAQNSQGLSPQVINLAQNQPTQSNDVNQQNLNALPNSSGTNVGSMSRPDRGIADFTFSYDEQNSQAQNNGQCTPKNCVLPGTFARAVLLGAADANASVNGQSNTTPILFRILGRGVLPNGYHSNLAGCFVVGEVYGDISSERGEVKLSQISCVIKGKTISKSINGTAYFMGKEGVRGRAIMRNGPLLWNAGVAGMLSGLAQGLQQAQQTQSISPLGTTTTVDSNRIATSMAAGGVQSAANTLANYYVKRADQYHPIIELNAGTIVNLVFLNQFTLSPDVGQSSGALVTTHPSNNYWKNPNAQNDASQSNLKNLSYGDSVSSNQAGAIQNQINQAGQGNATN